MASAKKSRIVPAAKTAVDLSDAIEVRISLAKTVLEFGEALAHFERENSAEIILELGGFSRIDAALLAHRMLGEIECLVPRLRDAAEVRK